MKLSQRKIVEVRGAVDDQHAILASSLFHHYTLISGLTTFLEANISLQSTQSLLERSAPMELAEKPRPCCPVTKKTRKLSVRDQVARATAYKSERQIAHKSERQQMDVTVFVKVIVSVLSRKRNALRALHMCFAFPIAFVFLFLTTAWN